MKKFLAILLAVIMLLSMVACAEVGNDTTDEEETKTEEKAEKKTEEEKNTEEKKTEENKHEETKPVKLVRGVVVGNQYSNAFNGLTFVAPSNTWAYMSKADLATQFGVNEALLQEFDFEKKLGENNMIPDMMVVDAATGNNVSVLWENLEKSINNKNISEKDYFDLVYAQLSSLGYERVGETKTATVSGIPMTYVQITVQGSDMDQYLFCKNYNGIMLSVTVTIMDGTSFETAMSWFK